MTVTPTTSIPALTPHQAKRQLRALLDQVQAYWQAAAAQADQDGLWPRYLPLLEACKDILFYAPLHPNEARQLTSERRLDKALERLASALKIALFEAELGELDSYLVDQLTRDRRRRAGLNRYLRAKQARRKRYNQKNL